MEYIALGIVVLFALWWFVYNSAWREYHVENMRPLNAKRWRGDWLAEVVITNIPVFALWRPPTIRRIYVRGSLHRWYNVESGRRVDAFDWLLGEAHIKARWEFEDAEASSSS